MAGGETPGSDAEYCQHCGQELAPTADDCEECGREVPPLHPAAVEPQSAPEADDAEAAVEETNETAATPERGWSTRRKVLAGGMVCGAGAIIGVAVLAGAFEPPHSAAPEEAWSGDQSPSVTNETVEGTVRVDAGEYYARSIRSTRPIVLEIDVDVQSGGPVDLYVMHQREREAYSDRGEHVTHRALSETAVTDASTGARLSPVEHAVVIDNTGVFGTEPDGEAVVDLAVSGSG